VFHYFPDNYTWSSAVMLSIMAGGQLGQVDRWLAPLRNGESDIHAWTTAWDNAAADQEEHAEHDLRQGFRRSASARDDPDPARQLIADWFADRLTTIPARPC
jgi:hypothetical protein